MHQVTPDQFQDTHTWMLNQSLDIQLLFKIRYWYTPDDCIMLPMDGESDIEYEHIRDLATGKPISRAKYNYIEFWDRDDLKSRFPHLVTD